MSKPIPTKLFLPKQLFSSLTDWTKANYTSWGWKNVSIDTNSWTILDGVTMTQVDNATFSFRGKDKSWGSCGTGAVTKLITGLHAVMRCPKTSSFIKVLIGTTDLSKDHKSIYPTFTDGSYNYFVIDTDEGISRFCPNEGTTDWMDIRFFDPYIVLKSHLKPISVGDKLGLVYWDGFVTPTAGGAIRSTSTLPGYTNCRIWCGSDSTASGPLFLNWYATSLIRQDKLLTKPGTINLSGYELTVAQIETSTTDYLSNHLFHVI